MPQYKFKGTHVYQKNIELFTAQAYEAIGKDYTASYSTATGEEMPVPAYTGIPLCLKGSVTSSAEDASLCTVEEASLANYNLYTGVNETAVAINRPVSVRTSGIVWLPVGHIAITIGDWVQLTPDILNYSAATPATVVAGDVIPCFSIEVISHAVAAYTADASETIDFSKEILKIDSAVQVLLSTDGGANPAVVSQLTLINSGYPAAAAAAGGTTASGEIAVIGSVGQYSTAFQIGDTLTDSIILIEAWVKGAHSAPHVVGQAITSGNARTAATVTDYVAVKLKGL
jgi:hypothetical protein